MLFIEKVVINMKREYLFGVLGGFVFLIGGVVLGFLIGTYLGGNYFPHFRLWTFQGYEATGWIGIIVGGILGAVFGALLGFNLAKLDRYD